MYLKKILLHQRSLPTLPAWWWLLVLWLLLGIFGREPWKPDEATNLTWFMYFYQGGTWRDFLLSHPQASTAAPAGYYLWAAACARFLGTFEPIVAARLLNIPLFFITVLASSATVAYWFGARYAKWFALMLAAQLGLLLPIHHLVAENLLLSGLAIAFWSIGLSTWRTRGLVFAIGLLLIWWAKGVSAWLGLLFLSVTWPYWRNERRHESSFGLLLGWSLAIGVVWVLVAWSAVGVRGWWNMTHDAWLAWWQPHAELDLAFYARTLLWFAWPSLPLSVWLLWRQRQFWYLHYPHAMRFAAGVILALCIQILCIGVERDIALLPLLLPLSWLAAVAVERLPRNLASASEWFAFLTFAVLGASLWLTGVWWQYALPPWLAVGAQQHYAPPVWNWGAGGVALLASGVWWWQVRRRFATGSQALITWMAGLSLWWSLVMTLWLPWLDANKSYRPLLLSLKAALPTSVSCLRLQNVSPAVEGLLVYFVRIPVTSQTNSRACTWVLQQGEVPAGAKVYWQGKRNTDNSERFTLYR